MTDRLDFAAHFDVDLGAVERAREQPVEVAPVDPGGPILVCFEDGADVHEVVLRRDGDEWHGDCWMVDDGGDRTGRCRGHVYHDAPCAHLWAVRSAVAGGEVEVRDAAEERADHAVEKAMADGGRRADR